MKPCLDYMELMNAVLDGEAAPAQEAELTAHLAVCPACAALYEDLKALREGAGALVVPAPEGFAGKVMEQVRAEAPNLRVLPKKKRQPWRSVAAMAAVCAIVLLGATSLNYLDFGRSGSTTAAAPEAAPAAVMDTAAESKVYGAAGESQQAPVLFSADRATRGVEGNTTEKSTADSKNTAAGQNEPAQAAPADIAPVETAAPAEAPAGTLAVGSMAQDEADRVPQALELVLERIYGDSGYTVEKTYSADGLSCTVRLLDGETLVDEGRVACTGLSPNEKFYCFAWTWEGQSLEDAALFRYAVPLDHSNVMWAGEVLDGGASYQAALEE